MKKLYFFFLLLPLWGFGGIAHASVAVQVLATDFPNKTVTLHVEYDYAVNDRVWIWIYLCSMQGMFQPAEISAASATSGSVLYLSTNTRGFFVTASPATITATLDNATGRFSCCAYGSDTPPNITLSSGTYTFKGTPPFTLIAADGAATQTVPGNTLPTSALTITPVTITDETGYLDFFDFCSYTRSDLYVDASHRCQQRSSGAQNWEAWILDSRDNELYRIVYMPDNKWWLAQNVKYAGKGVAPDWCGKDECGRVYTQSEARNGQSSSGNITGICPNGWLIPVLADWSSLITGVRAQGVRVTTLTPHTTCGLVGDYFGWADLINVYTGSGGLCACIDDPLRQATKFANDATHYCRGVTFRCDDVADVNYNYACVGGVAVRCFRQL